MRPTRFTGLLFAVLLVLVGPRPADAGERWYVLEMQGQRAGWTVEAETEADGRIVTTSESRLTIRRGETAIEMAMASRFVESASGKPIEMSARTDLGGAPSVDRWIFGAEGVRWISETDGRRTEKTLPMPEGSWLPPAAASRYTRSRLAAEAEEITVRTIDPLNGLEPVLTTRSGFVPETMAVLGRHVDAIRCDTRSSVYPDSTGIEYIDTEGTLLRSELVLGAMTITVIAADEQLAKSDLDPPELMASLFISPDRAIRDPYTKKRGVYILRATSGTLPDIPAVGSQTVQRIDPGAVRIQRSLDDGPAVDVADDEIAACSASSAMISCEDPRVIELKDAALAAGPDAPAARAEVLRRFVHRHIRSKDLSVGFASAAETARTREGDCTEHGVLLAAMLRADGIPARVVSGLIYADRFAGGRDIFGYHMWAQALLPIDPRRPDAGHRWVDLDATLPDHLPVTATHIALGVHTLAGDSRANALVELAPLMGRLAVQVESVE